VKSVCMLFTRLAVRSSIRSGGEKEQGEQENTKMARKSCRALASTEHTLTCLRTHLLQRYEKLVALHLTDLARLRERFKEQGR